MQEWMDRAHEQAKDEKLSAEAIAAIMKAPVSHGKERWAQARG